jgi:hypothetical protein
MKTKQHYGAKEYFGDRPCIDPVVMQYLQTKLRSVQANPARNETLIGKIKNIINYYSK